MKRRRPRDGNGAHDNPLEWAKQPETLGDLPLFAPQASPFEQGMAASNLAAAVKWTAEQRATVHRAIRAVAQRRAHFSSDDLWAELGPEFPVTKGLAGAMMAAVNMGWIRSTGQTTTSKRDAHCHSQRLTVWQSLIIDSQASLA